MPAEPSSTDAATAAFLVPLSRALCILLNRDPSTRRFVPDRPIRPIHLDS
jgi:hypothetical protein